MTRLAASPSELWTPLLKHNAAHIKIAIDALITQLSAVRDTLQDAKAPLTAARSNKRQWPLVRAGRLADRVAESPTGAMLSEILRRQALGEQIAPLHVGEPRLPLSADMRALVGEASAAAPIIYTQTAGMVPLRERVANGRSIDEVIVTAGAKQALHLALASLVAPGDEVLVPQPAWVSFAELVRLAGGKAIAVETTADAQLDPSAFAAAITPHTRAVILNTPNNPTGAVYKQHALDAVLAICAQHDLWLLSDELYRSFVFEGVHVSPIARYPLAQTRGVLFDGIAKSHGMTGLRIGWAVGPRALIARMVRLASHETSCASSVSQHVARAILDRYPTGDPALLAAVTARRQQLLASQRNMGPMQGAFYAWLKVDGSSRVAARELLARGVATMPGAAFGREGYLRLSYAVEEAVLTRALALLG
jgi:aspartate aminotransferase